jgi:prepilin-type N-terminal cleavage/methylation domain-containing protein/prepilin-type processing-associated H-X9-DG protein
MKSSNRKGFTLIELLVVIAIIAILAAILFPVFAKAREKARQSTCQSNVKEIGIAFNMYSQDYDETYPLQWSGYATYDGGIGNWSVAQPAGQTNWAYCVVSYIKGNKLFCCPTAGDAQNQISYQANYRVLGQAEASITKPADTVLLLDANADTGGTQPITTGSAILQGTCRVTMGAGTNAATSLAIANPSVTAEYNPTGLYVGGIGQNPDASGATSTYEYAIHSSGMLVGYCDGHVKWQKWGQLNALVGNGSTTTPNNPFLPNQQ